MINNVIITNIILENDTVDYFQKANLRIYECLCPRVPKCTRELCWL